MRILEAMPDDFALVEMGVDDIVRSGLVRNYLLNTPAASNDTFATTTACFQGSELERFIIEGVRH